jgi:Polyketide cyclase / dehydrase and lipid transport
MTTLTTILIVLAAVVAVLLIVALFVSKNLTIEQRVLIDKPNQDVFEFIKYTKNQDHYSVWNMTDPEMAKTYTGTDGQVGFVYAWDSVKRKNVGAGKQETKAIDNGKSITFEIRFSRPMPDVAKAQISTEAVSANQTQVQWGFYSQMKYPMNIMKPVIKNMLSKDLAKGLVTLKTVLEKG